MQPAHQALTIEAGVSGASLGRARCGISVCARSTKTHKHVRMACFGGKEREREGAQTRSADGYIAGASGSTPLGEKEKGEERRLMEKREGKEREGGGGKRGRGII